MKDVVKVALVQMDVVWLNPVQNLSRIEKFIEFISTTQPVDLIVFPELVNTGYITERDRKFALKIMKVAEKIPGDTTKRLCELAKQANVNLALGFCELHQTIPATLYNSAILIDRHGEILGVQRKIHIPAEEKHYFCPGTSISTFPTDIGTIGLSICADNRFPEYTRTLALKGAEIVCAVFNAPEYIPPISSSSLPNLEYLASIRALENINYFVLCNRIGKQEDIKFKGKSVIAAPTGEILTMSKKDKQEILFAELTNELLLTDRGFNPVFRDRRPEMYSSLCEQI